MAGNTASTCWIGETLIYCNKCSGYCCCFTCCCYCCSCCGLHSCLLAVALRLICYSDLFLLLVFAVMCMQLLLLLFRRSAAVLFNTYVLVFTIHLAALIGLPDSCNTSRKVFFAATVVVACVNNDDCDLLLDLLMLFVCSYAFMFLFCTHTYVFVLRMNSHSNRRGTTYYLQWSEQKQQQPQKAYGKTITKTTNGILLLKY